MIISASRRTDIPAFYSKWFMERIKEGYCSVPNPFNRKQVSFVSLKPKDVDVIVFWTRNPTPLIPYLDELDKRGFYYYFQYTVLDNPREIDIKSPPLEQSLKTFKELSEKIGSERVIWRYDPIVISTITPIEFHIRKYERVARELKGFTNRSVISIVDKYKKASKRFNDLKKIGIEIIEDERQDDEQLGCLMGQIVQMAKNCGFEIFSCSEVLDLARFGVKKGKCIDDIYIRKTFNITVNQKKDPNQREECGCVISKDIGMYDSCLYGCQYCYATQSFTRAEKNFEKHNPKSPSLIGWYDATQKDPNQLTLL